jgi:hypothetical protein
MRTFHVGLVAAALLIPVAAIAGPPDCYPSFLPKAGKFVGKTTVAVPKNFCKSGRAWFVAGENRGNVVIRERTCGCA